MQHSVYSPHVLQTITVALLRVNSFSSLHVQKKKTTSNNILLAALMFRQVGVEVHYSGCDVIPVHPSQVIWQRQHGGQSLLTQFPVVAGAKSVSDEVRGTVGVKGGRDAGLPLQQEFVQLTQFQLPLRHGYRLLGFYGGQEHCWKVIYY